MERTKITKIRRKVPYKPITKLNWVCTKVTPGTHLIKLILRRKGLPYEVIDLIIKRIILCPQCHKYGMMREGKPQNQEFTEFSWRVTSKKRRRICEECEMWNCAIIPHPRSHNGVFYVIPRESCPSECFICSLKFSDELKRKMKQRKTKKLVLLS